MMEKKKKIIIGSIIAVAVILVGTLTTIGFNLVKNELQEAIKLIEQQEKEAKELEEQQEQTEKEHQEKLAKWEQGWNTLGDNQQYFTLGTDHLKRTINSDETTTFSWSVEFIGALYMIDDGVFNGIKKNELNMFLGIALQNLPDNATGKEVYDAILKATELFNVDELKSGVGEDPLAGLVQTDPEPTPAPTQQSNQSSNKNNNSSSNKNNSSSSNQSSNTTPPADDSDDNSGDGSSFAAQFGGSQVEGNPEDHKSDYESNSDWIIP